MLLSSHLEYSCTFYFAYLVYFYLNPPRTLYLFTSLEGRIIEYGTMHQRDCGQVDVLYIPKTYVALYTSCRFKLCKHPTLPIEVIRNHVTELQTCGCTTNLSACFIWQCHSFKSKNKKSFQQTLQETKNNQLAIMQFYFNFKTN